jgi:hypothetical protein
VKTRGRRSFDVFSLSFLDCICCGFGAILLLLVLTKGGAPRALERSSADLAAAIARLEAEIARIRGESPVLARELTASREQLSREEALVALLRGDLTAIQGQFAATRDLSEIQEILAGRLLQAQQTLSAEEKRLLAQADRRPPPPSDAPVAGIPVDSEYVIFVIDTSGSMFNYAWPLMLQKMEEVLDAYPHVQGIQVMNDEGTYMFPTYARKWIPDTPARRRAILDKLRTWNVFSDSSPVEGIEAAILAYGGRGRRVSIYVLGDEFTGESIDRVVRHVRRINPPDARGERPVRIHAIGFPTTLAGVGMPEATGIRFSTLMRLVCEDNGGAFVALNATRR